MRGLHPPAAEQSTFVDILREVCPRRWAVGDLSPCSPRIYAGATSRFCNYIQTPASNTAPSFFFFAGLRVTFALGTLSTSTFWQLGQK